jgi:ubiquitin-like domain-containing CTD phosphatase 1
MTATLEELNKLTTSVTVGDTSKKIYQEPNLRYRADDEQRTLMSGQILLRGLFGPEILAADEDDDTTVIKLHTGDYKKDVLVINKNICPRVGDLEAEAYESEEFKQWNETSVEVQIIRKFAQTKLGLDVIPFGILDCLMTTMCTDRPLPELIDDYDGSLGPTPWKEDGSEGIAIVSEKDFTNIFERFVNYVSVHRLFSPAASGNTCTFLTCALYHFLYTAGS